MRLDCTVPFAQRFRCPTKEQYLEQLMALLPRGRAWQSHNSTTSANVTRYTDGIAEAGEAQMDEEEMGQPALLIERTILASFFAAIAEMFEHFSLKACKLLDEFFCETIDETFDVWADDYGFPDPCWPWDELCEKVAAQGGASCAYIVWAAARRGWKVDCRDCESADYAAMAGCAMAGCSWPCAPCDANVLHITIDIENSPSYTVRRSNPPMAGIAMAGCASACSGPDPQQIECLIERIKPAHVEAVYHYI